MILILALLAAQDFQGLVSDDVEVRDRAFEELVRMGPKALPAIRAAKAEGDLKLLLEKAVWRIERPAKVAARIPVPVRVTLEARERSFKGVLEELSRLGGRGIVSTRVPERPLTVSLDQVPFWEALDRVCRTQEGVEWEGFLVRDGVHRPAAVQGDVALKIGSIYSCRGLLVIDMRVAALPAAALDFLQVRAECEAAPGTTLEVESPVVRVWEPEFDLALKGRNRPVGETLARVKGVATLEYVVEKRVLAAATLKDLAKAPVEREGIRISLDLAEGCVRARAAGGRLERLRRSEFVFADDKGTTQESRQVWDWDTESRERIVFWRLDWPEGFGAVSFELREPEDVEVVKFPFEFKDVPVGR